MNTSGIQPRIHPSPSLDLATRTITRVATPGLGYENIPSLFHLATNPPAAHRSNGTIAALATRITGGAREIILLTPVTVEELSPKLVDNADAAIPGSKYATPLPASNAMVERDPIGRTAVPATATAPAVTAIPAVTDASTRRIAWRDMKVKVGNMFAGRTVTWSMRPLFTPHERGQSLGLKISGISG